MTTYFINEGTFDSLDVGMVDSTVHLLRFPGGVRLLIDRKPLRNGASPRALALSRTQHESRQLPKFTVLAEREGEVHGMSTFDVAAYFRSGADLVYQLRRHFVRQPLAFAFTLRGAMASRDDIDARMDRLLDTLRFRPTPDPMGP